MSNQVGLIGVGALGTALLKRLRAAGKDVKAFDTAPGGQEAAKNAGAEVMDSAAAASRGAAYIHVVVASDEQVLQATTARDGVLMEAPAGAMLFLHSTTLPTTTMKVAEAAAAKGIRALDAPIAGVPKRFEAGEGIFLVGGPLEEVEAVRPYLLELGSEVLHFGPLGSGNVTKLVKALYNAGERVLLAEILNLAEAGGLNVQQFLKMQIATHDKPAVAQWADNFTLEGNHAVHRPTTNLFRKDVALAAKLSEMYDLEAPLTEGVALTARRWLKSWGQDPDSA